MTRASASTIPEIVVEILDDYFPLIVCLSGPRIDATEMRQMSEGFEKFFERGERYTLLNLTPRDFSLPDAAGRRLVSDWVHHPRVRDFTRRLCIGAVSVHASMLYRIAFNLVMAVDRPVTEMKCVATLQEGLEYCTRRIREERLPFDRPVDLVRYEVQERLRHAL